MKERACVVKLNERVREREKEGACMVEVWNKKEIKPGKGNLRIRSLQ